MSYRIAPGAVLFKLAGAILDAILPLVTVYLAAQSTTELAAAYSGVAGAGQRAIIYVLLTIAIGAFTTAWSSIDNYVQSILRFKVESRISDIMYAVSYTHLTLPTSDLV